MKIDIKIFKIEIEWIFFTLLIISIFSLKVRGYFASYYVCYLFILFHEMAHILVGSIFGQNVKILKLTTCGVSAVFENNILYSNQSYIKKMLIFIAGPLSNLILALIFRKEVMIFQINMFLAILNIIPIFPLDGYNIVKIMVKNCKKDYTEYISYFLLIILFIFSIIQVMLYKTFTLLVFLVYLFLFKKINEKNNINYHQRC
ncbi:peptidase M50 [Clostridium sp. CAG:1219]|nr:peptidase M50 [Clostridium sp. CAG:1219]